MRRMTKIAATCLMSGLWAQQTLVPPDTADLAITIYNDNRAFVHEIRHVPVKAGKQRLVYPNVPPSVIPASVIPDFSGVGVTLYSQNYVYDLITLPSMLKKSVGKTIHYRPGKSESLREGTLLGDTPPIPVQDAKTGRIVMLQKPSQVVFDGVPAGMITRPSLVWNIEAQNEGNLTVDLQYLSTGIRWKSDYVLDLHPRNRTLDLVGWITVDNRSGVDYPDARITCLAGEVHMARPKRGIVMTMAAPMRKMAAPQVKEEAFSAYHIYKIPFRETIRNKEQKQIRFLEKKGIGYDEFGKAVIHSFQRQGEITLRFVDTVRFQNSTSNHLGVPLPAGIVRMYGKDSDGNPHFVGESRIENTPVDENVSLQLGTLFDVTGTKKTTKYVSRERYLDVESTYTLHNRGKTPRTLKIEERVPTYGGTIHLKTSCAGPCSVRKLTAFVREFTIRLKGGESYSFTSEFEVIR